MKKVFLILLMFIILKLSATSGLRVIDPTTWFNETEYIKESGLEFLVNFESDFYLPYDNILNMNFILHKLSHIIFYSLLGFLFYINFNKKMKYALPALFLFAFSDEILQYFVIGRSGRILDVSLDFIAGTICILIFKQNLKKKKKN